MRSRNSASRTGVRLTPRRVPISVSEKRSPGSSWKSWIMRLELRIDLLGQVGCGPLSGGRRWRRRAGAWCRVYGAGASAKWQATSCGPTARSAGASRAQRSSPRGQRPWKRQTCGGGSIGLATSPDEPDARPLPRDRRHQRLRVRMLGRAEHLLRRADLDQLAEVHHRHAVGQQAHHVEVVRDEQQRQAELARAAARAAAAPRPAPRRRAPRSARRGSAGAA